MLNAHQAKFFVVILRGRLFIITPPFSFNSSTLLGVIPTDKKVASFTHQLKNEGNEFGFISFWISELSNSCSAY